MQATVRTYRNLDGMTATRQPTPRQLAATYAEKFRETCDAQFGFAAIKHAANTVFMNPAIISDKSGLIHVVVDEVVADRFRRLRETLRKLLPGVTLMETAADAQKRCALQVTLPLAPLSDNDLFGILDHTVTALDRKEVERVVNFFMGDAESLLTACRERSSKVNTVVSSLFDAKVVDEFGASPVHEEYSDATQDRFVYAVQTRRDGGFYRMVADIMGNFYEK